MTLKHGLLIIACCALLSCAHQSADEAENDAAASYYNSMLTGSDRTGYNCGNVYERMKGYNVFVIASCGYGTDADCNKRIKYTGSGGISAVRGHFATVISNLDLELEATVNSKPKCEF